MLPWVLTLWDFKLLNFKSTQNLTDLRLHMLLILHSASATYLFISQWDHSIPLIFLIVSKLPLLFRFHFITWSHFCLSVCVMETSHLRNLSLIYFICWKCYNMEKVSVACIHIIYVEFTLHYNHFTITSRQWIDAKYTC